MSRLAAGESSKSLLIFADGHTVAVPDSGLVEASHWCRHSSCLVAKGRTIVNHRICPIGRSYGVSLELSSCGSAAEFGWGSPWECGKILLAGWSCVFHRLVKVWFNRSSRRTNRALIRSLLLTGSEQSLMASWAEPIKSSR